MLNQECYNKQTLITYNQYTKFHLSDTCLNIININKRNITETMKYKLKWEDNCTLKGNLFENTLEQFKLFKLFVYLKNDTHNFDIYRIYINHQQNVFSNKFNLWTRISHKNEIKIWNI